MEHKDIQQEVLAKIRSGEISMRPKAYFAARVVLLVVLSAITIFLSIFLLSFIFFGIHASGKTFLLGFGEPGIATFFLLAPWLLLSVVVLLLVIIEWLLHSFRFGYRIPLLYVFLGLLAATVIVGTLVTVTPLHKTFLEKADHGELPFIGRWYQEVRESHTEQGVFRGTIIFLSGDHFVLSHDDTDDDGAWVVATPPGFNISTLHIGDKVYVAGSFVPGQDSIAAYGITILPPNQLER